MTRRRRFLIWLAVLATGWGLANWPQSGGTFKFRIERAGFPWTVAFWEHGHLQWFDTGAMAADLGVLLALVPLAWLCAWSADAPSHTRSKRV
jgi:hypothetical protein